jgi:inorganic pyrophosphatase
MPKKKITLLIISTTFVVFYSGCQRAVPGISEDCKYKDIYTIDCGKNLLKDYPAINADTTINVIVETPAGTVEKWEVNGKIQNGTKPDDGKLRWEFNEGKPRVIQYLPYPGSYGFIPNTKGGDGDPLDVLLLGPSIQRGTVVSAKCIGVLKMLDGSDVDDKVLAVKKYTPFFEANDLEDLDYKFPGVKDIVKIWFSNYKGPGEMTFIGWGDKIEAVNLIQRSIQ